MSRRSLLVLAPLVVAAATVWWRWPDPVSPTTTPAAVDITSTAPTFATLDELASTSDLVVAGTVTASSDGRVITAADDPGAGIRTVLLSIDTAQVLAGEPPAGGPLVIEHEATLLDGTAITVDGVPPPAVDEPGVFFLVAGDPYHVIVGPQGSYRLTGSDLQTPTSDPLAARIAALDLNELSARLAVA